ncbi:MAG: hemin ABC transporter ATP-binding protein, partial [Pseudomonadota bacterium]
LDEPTSDLDLAHGLLVLNLAQTLTSLGVGVLVVLHDLNLAARFCDRIVLMDGGRIVEHGEPAYVLKEQLLSDVYCTDIHVEWHRSLERIVVHT